MIKRRLFLKEQNDLAYHSGPALIPSAVVLLFSQKDLNSESHIAAGSVVGWLHFIKFNLIIDNLSYYKKNNNNWIGE